MLEVLPDLGGSCSSSAPIVGFSFQRLLKVQFVELGGLELNEPDELVPVHEHLSLYNQPSGFLHY